MLRITIANSGIVAAQRVVVTPATTTPGVLLGPPIDLGGLPANSQVDVAIPVQVARTAPVQTALDIALRVDSDAGCSTDHLVVALHGAIGVDDRPAVAASDGLETQILAWTPAGDLGGALWRRAGEPSGNHVLRGREASVIADSQLVSPVLQVSATEPLVVALRHSYDLAATQFPGVYFNGGVIELSSDGGATWRDVRQLGVDPGYPGTISIDFLNPLSGRRVFGGKNPSFPARDPLTLDFGTRFAGQAIQLRFRIGTSSCCTASGWDLDDIAITGITNTPFPAHVAEPTRCYGAATAAASSIVAIRSAPEVRFDGAAATP